MARKRQNCDNGNLEPQRSSAAEFLTYVAAKGLTNEQFEIRYEDESIWMSQKMLAAVYGVEVPNIAYHLRRIFEDAELDKDSVIKEILITAADGKTYQVKHYNLKVIIALGFKINNERAIQFRKWANETLQKYVIQGWVLDEKRLKEGHHISPDYFDKLVEEIREIRLSERRFYQKITDLYATALDYDKTALTTRKFFASVQNQMHLAIHGHTAAQILYTRADASKDHMGLTTWENAPDGKIQKSDVVVAKNYLSDQEMTRLNRMTNAYIDYAENMAEEHVPLTMEDWARVLGKFIDFWSQSVPERCVEEVTAALAKAHAEAEFAKYRIVQDKLFMSDYDRYLLALEEEAKKAGGER